MHRDLEQFRHVGGRRRQNLAHRVGGVLEQHAGRLALFVAHNHTAVRIGRVLGDAGKLQRLRVHRDDVAAARDEHRIIRRDRVKLVPRRRAAFFQNAFVPAGGGHYPFAGLGAGNTLADRFLHVRDGLGPEELHRRSVQRREQLVQMRVDQARHHGLAGELDHLRVGANVIGHDRIVADRDKSPAAYRDRLRDTPIVIDGDDLAAAQHEVCGLREGGGSEES